MPTWLGREFIVVRSSASFPFGAGGGPIKISGSQARYLPGWIRSGPWRFESTVLPHCVCGFMGGPVDIWCLSLLLWYVWTLSWPHYLVFLGWHSSQFYVDVSWWICRPPVYACLCVSWMGRPKLRLNCNGRLPWDISSRSLPWLGICLYHQYIVYWYALCACEVLLTL